MNITEDDAVSIRVYLDALYIHYRDQYEKASHRLMRDHMDLSPQAILNLEYARDQLESNLADLQRLLGVLGR